MMKKTKAERLLDILIEQEYYKQGQNVQINIMDISRIYADCRSAIGRGESLPDAMRSALDKYGVFA